MRLWNSRRLKIASILFLAVILTTTFLFINRTHQSFTEVEENNPVPPRQAVGAEKQTVPTFGNTKSQVAPFTVGPGRGGGSVESFSCLVNGDIDVACLHDPKTKEIYFPFDGFLKNYLEIQGFYAKDSKTGEQRFEWWHSYAKIHLPNQNYEPAGVYGPFALYNVENRDRVKCVSGAEGVPMSVQWAPDPYFYPIQIAQFALEHYSKNFTESAPKVVRIGSDWQMPPDFRKNSVLETVEDVDLQQKVTHIKTEAATENPGVFVHLDAQELHVLQLEIRLAPNASFTVTVKRSATQEFFKIHYTQMKFPTCVVFVEEDSSIFYGITGKFINSWHRFTRNIQTDFMHGLAAGGKRKKKRGNSNKHKMEKIILVSLAVRGEAWVGGVRQATSAHRDQFLDAANWLVENQDEKGGWPVPVKRSLAGRQLYLEPGWYSAMGQGHGMSVLCRAYELTKDDKFLKSAQRATGLFSVDASAGGVMNYFMGHPWYEEYPTTPGSFVLNGFIYSLIGLYDLKIIGGKNKAGAEAARLYEEGLKSLKSLLPIFDTGSGSVYDLRHVALQNVAPNLARWDYHSVHIYQLLWLYNLEKEEMFKSYADRWIRYSNGERAKHN